MHKDSIIHFVGFITAIEPEDFVPQWESFARHFKTRSGGMSLQQEQEKLSKSRFKYLSRHEYRDGNIRFTFMKGRSSEHFPEQQVKVVQAGGYSPIQLKCKNPGSSKDVTIMVFVTQKKNDAGFVSDLPFQNLNIYQAYYENCMYSHILEYLVPEKETAVLLEHLKQIEGIEVSMFMECMVPHL